jgi:hypothetical protein
MAFEKHSRRNSRRLMRDWCKLLPDQRGAYEQVQCVTLSLGGVKI